MNNNLLIITILFIIGTIFGSFLYCIVYRYINNISFISGRSKCDYCGHTLSVKDLIPIFSFIINKGRCRHCHHKLDYSYLISEVLTGVIYVSLYIKYGLTIKYLMYLILVSLMIIISFIDYKTYIIPDIFIILGTINMLIFKENKPFSLINGLMISLFLLILRFVMNKIKSFSWSGKTPFETLDNNSDVVCFGDSTANRTILDLNYSKEEIAKTHKSGDFVEGIDFSITDFFKEHSGKNHRKLLWLGKLNKSFIDRVYIDTGFNLSGKSLVLASDNYKHLEKHNSENFKKYNNPEPITNETLNNLAYIINNYKYVQYFNDNGEDRLRFEIEIINTFYRVIMFIPKRNKSCILITIFSIKKGDLQGLDAINAPNFNTSANNGNDLNYAPKYNISNNNDIVNDFYKDSMGLGDIKLFFMLGSYLSIYNNLITILLSCVIGIIFIIITKKRMIPFGPSICIAYLIMFLVC